MRTTGVIMIVKRIRRQFRMSASAACLSFLLIFSGCATMGKNECLNAQWRNIGYEDGVRGYRATRLAKHRQACADYGISPDLDEYTAGRRLGLAEWCTAANGFYQGRRGRVYKGVCPPELEGSFLSGMNHGREVYSYNREIDKREKHLREAHDDLFTMDEEIDSLEEELIIGEAGHHRRRLILDELRALEREREYLSQSIAEDEQRLESMKNTLDLLYEEYQKEHGLP